MNLTIDIAIFLGFLTLYLIVGFFYGRGVKTMQDYALGGRDFSTGALVATLVTALVSRSVFFYYPVQNLFGWYILYAC